MARTGNISLKKRISRMRKKSLENVKENEPSVILTAFHAIANSADSDSR